MPFPDKQDNESSILVDGCDDLRKVVGASTTACPLIAQASHVFPRVGVLRHEFSVYADVVLAAQTRTPQSLRVVGNMVSS